MPSSSEPSLRVIRIALSGVNPVLVLLVLFLYGLDVRGYSEAARYLATSGALSLAAIVLGVVLYFVLRDAIQERMRRVFRTRLEAVPAEAHESEQGRHLFHLRVVQLLVLWGIGAAAVAAVLLVFGIGLARAGELLAISVYVRAGGEPVAIRDLLLSILSIYFSLRVAEILRGIETHHVFPRTRIGKGGEFALQAATKHTIVTLGVLLAFGAMKFRLSDFQWFLAAAGVGIGFGLQELIANFFCGFVLLVERPVQVGDVVEIGGVPGQVEEITIRSTTIRTFENRTLIIPNKFFLNERVIHLSQADPKIRRDVAIGVAYGSDVGRVRKLLQEVLDRDGRILSRPAPEVLLDDFGESSIRFILRFWPSPDPNVAWPTLKSDLLAGIAAIFARNGIEIPFPQRELRLRALAPEILSLIEATARSRPAPNESRSLAASPDASE